MMCVGTSHAKATSSSEKKSTYGTELCLSERSVIRKFCQIFSTAIILAILKILMGFSHQQCQDALSYSMVVAIH